MLDSGTMGRNMLERVGIYLEGILQEKTGGGGSAQKREKIK